MVSGHYEDSAEYLHCEDNAEFRHMVDNFFNLENMVNVSVKTISVALLTPSGAHFYHAERTEFAALHEQR